jgi:hypothetical protein
MRLSKLFMCVAVAAGSAFAEPAALSISVLAGDDVSVSTRNGRGADIKVVVTGPDNQPVEDATVTAVLPGIGAGGSFAGGETVKSQITTSDGTAEFRGIRLRPVAGDIPIRIVARHGQQFGATTVHQKAAAVEAGDPGSAKRRMAMLAIVGGGVSAAVLALTMGGADEPVRPPFNVTPGAPVTAGPR